jgi:hypothetical protein
LESAVLFKLIDRDRIAPFEKGGKFRYQCSEAECDAWAGLFGYDENNKWRFKFLSDSNLIDQNDISVTLGDLRDYSAWEEFINRLDIEDEPQKSLPEEGSKELSLSGGFPFNYLKTNIYNFFDVGYSFDTRKYRFGRPVADLRSVNVHCRESRKSMRSKTLITKTHNGQIIGDRQSTGYSFS